MSRRVKYIEDLRENGLFACMCAWFSETRTFPPLSKNDYSAANSDGCPESCTVRERLERSMGLLRCRLQRGGSAVCAGGIWLQVGVTGVWWFGGN